MVDARRLVEQVRDNLARAQTAAQAQLSLAHQELDAELARQKRMAAWAKQVPRRAAAAREERLRLAAARNEAAMAQIAVRATRAADAAAPGAASILWDGWVPTPLDRAVPQPPLRIGETAVAGCPPVPVLVPLLDHAHLAVRLPERADPAHRATADGVINAVLLRALGCAQAGSVRLTGYDPEHLGGSLAGFARLAGAGLLTFVGPGGLGRLLDELVDDIRRINESVLAGEYGSLRELVLAEGRRPEPWRVAVLLGGGGDELTRHEQAQLDRVLRTGVACGVHLIVRGIPVREDLPTVRAVSLEPGAGSPARQGNLGSSPAWQGNLVGSPARQRNIGGSPGPRDRSGGTARDGRSGPEAPSGPDTPDHDGNEDGVGGGGGGARVSGCGALPVLLDPPPSTGLVARVCRDLAERVSAGPVPAEFRDLLPAKPWTENSRTGLTAPVGEGTDDRLVELTLADYPPHALIGGPSGTGKTNLIYAWLGALAARYPPSEVEFYLLDFKEGVSFARFAPSPRDPTWLPQVRLVGVNVNTDREFGLALLRFLAGELRSRAAAAKKFEVTKLEELRAEDPDGHWPRIVAVVDEFQELLAGRDHPAGEAAALLEDLARRGRSQGIHLILASQDVSGIQALWGRQGLVAQFTLRIALPKARRILHETNPAAELLPRNHAVINADSGSLAANRVTRIPHASERDAWADLQHQLWEARPEGLAPPRLFDGDAVPLLSDAPDYLAVLDAGPVGGGEPVALLGETIDVRRHSARLSLPRQPGRNLAVLGTRAGEACAVLGAAARSLAPQFPAGTARFSVACLDDGTDHEALHAARAVHAALPGDPEWYGQDTVHELLAETAAGLDRPGRPHFLILYAVDAASGRLAAARPGGSGHQHLRKIMLTGPERHIHVLGWWRGVARLRDDLGGIGAARYDSVGAWVALDVHGGELTPPLYPRAGGPSWYPRPWRALFFDRAVHQAAEVIVPYGLG